MLPTPRPRRQWPLALSGVGVLVLLALATAGLFALRSGVPQRVDRTTPHAQNGFTLLVVGLEAQNSGANPIHPLLERLRWVLRGRPIAPNPFGPEPGLRVDVPQVPAHPKPDDFSVMASSSQGDTFPLRWEITWKGGPGGQQYLFVYTPAGFPPDWRWLDVTVRDKQNRSARWRLGVLPRTLRHTLVPPVAVENTFRAHGLTAKARAYFDPALSYKKQSGPAPAPFADAAVPLVSEVRAANLPKDGEKEWRIALDRVICEWEPPVGAQGTSTDGYFSASSEHDRSSTVATTLSLPTPTASAQRFVRLHGALSQYDRLNEQVTFRDLPVRRVPGTGRFRLALNKPHTLTTRSGITLILSSRNDDATRFGGAGEVPFTLSLKPAKENVRLPASPLFRRHHKPVRVSFYLAGLNPWKWTASSGDTAFAVGVDEPFRGKTLPPLTITVQQETTLRSAPFTLTVPVTRGRPKNDWTPGSAP